jgi:hypothetical protein
VVLTFALPSLAPDRAGRFLIDRTRPTVYRMLRLLLVMLIESVAFTAAILWAVTSPGPLSATVATIVALGGVVLIAYGAFHGFWRPMVAPFPPREPGPDAVRRRYQSFSFGIVNMGLSIHVAADDEYLHLIPLGPWQALGATPASIPWSAMKPVGKSGCAAMVGGHRMVGPAWCMELIAPEPDAGAPDGEAADDADRG